MQCEQPLQEHEHVAILSLYFDLKRQDLFLKTLIVLPSELAWLVNQSCASYLLGHINKDQHLLIKSTLKQKQNVFYCVKVNTFVEYCFNFSRN